MKATRATDEEPFFSTKLAVPRAPRASVRRLRLLEALDGGASGPLTLLSAPAGSGKTSLLASWVEEGRAPGYLAWLSLGSLDDDRRRFWVAVVAALARGAGPLRSLAIPPRTRLEAFLPSLLDVIGELRRPLTLVLDDFHAVRDPAVIADVEDVLEHAPERLRLVVATRMDPSLRLERLRLTGRLAEIRMHDLAFTLDETREFGRELGLALRFEDITTLWRRTEGWAAGLRLAALSLKDHPDPHAFVQGFAGDDRALSDYLLEEVISRQPPETLDFLKRTAVADRLTGDLANAMTEDTGSDRMLAGLVHSDALVDTLSGGEVAYRYHPLFAEVLRMELARTSPDEVPELHRRASRWHKDHGQPLEAVRHAVEARDWELAGAVAGEHWLSLLIAGRGAALRQLLRPIPEDAVRASAELSVALAGLLLEAGDDAGADQLLLVAHELLRDLPEAQRRRLAVASTATDLYRARLRGDVEEAVSSASIVLDGHWEQDVAADVRALTLANLGIAEFWSDRMPDAARHVQEAAGLARECGNDYVLFLALGYAAAVDLHTGRLDEAWRRGRTALDLAEAGGWTTAPGAAISYLALAGVHVFWNELDAADELRERARSALRDSGELLLHFGVALLEARLLAARGDALTALDLLRGAQTAAGPSVPGFLRVWAGVLEAEQLLAVGETTEARSVLRELDTTESARDAAIELGCLELAIGEPREAIRAVVSFLADDRDAVQPDARVEAWVVDAIARDAIRDEQGAMRALERALDLGEPRGFRRAFVQHGAPVRSLMRRRIKAGTAHRAFASELLAALEHESGGGMRSIGPLLEPLSDRETAVLRYLPTMMSNAEIASEMFVSVNTVKTHLKHVYRKLDVADRREAVRRGRELHLLSPGRDDR
jgi:LuxR family transcriptional regulator, maltose regulon positive regulatory protein